MLNEYHPSNDQVDPNKNGTILLNLLRKSLSVNQTVSKSAVIRVNTKKLLKLLDPQLVLKNTINLADKIVLRELFIISYENFFDQSSRLTALTKKIDELSNGSELAQQLLKEANMTSNPLPAVFEYLNPFEKPVGVVDDFLTAFSRLYISQIIVKIVDFAMNESSIIFKPKAGEDLFPNLNDWLNNSKNSEQIDIIEELVNEASFLSEYYNKEDIELISKSFKQ